jgi:hypothetical protein
MNGKWIVRNAELHEGLTSAWGVLEIQNASPVSIEEARFYAEYYDAEGRLCFTLVFVSEANSDRDGSPIGPGDARELFSVAVALGPAAQPAEVKLRLISERVVGKPIEIAAGDKIVRSPVTTSGLSPDLLRLRLDPDQQNSGVVDVILARITVDSQGRSIERQILNSLGGEAQSWFERFVRQVHFQPGMAGIANTGTTLVLVRVINRIEGSNPASPELLSREAPWVKNYLRGFLGKELPTVMQWAFGPPSGAGTSPGGEPRAADANLFELVTAASEWSSNIVRVESQSGKFVRRWKPVAELLQ